jgi:hypothetical protein
LGGKVGIWKEARELVVMIEPKSTAPLIPPADKVTEGEKIMIILWNFSLDGSSHQTWDAAFTPAIPHDLQHSRANTRNTQE